MFTDVVVLFNAIQQKANVENHVPVETLGILLRVILPPPPPQVLLNGVPEQITEVRV